MNFEDDILFSAIRMTLMTGCTLGMMSTLTVYKYHAKKVLAVYGIFLLWVALFTAFILYTFGAPGFMRSFLLAVCAPAVLVACLMDKNTATQSVFNYATQIAFSLILSVISLLLNTCLRGNKLTELSIHSGLYALVIYLELRILRKPFGRLSNVIEKGWGILALIPVTFSILIVLVGTVPVLYIYNPVNILYLFGIIATMVIVYFVVYQSLMGQYRLQMLTRDRDLLKVQINAMARHSQSLMETEETLHILRHDIRHVAAVMRARLLEGFTELASETLDSIETAISLTARVSYCQDPVLNSILFSYLEQARLCGIKFQVTFCAPPSQVVDSTSFAVMLSNALENALHACKRSTFPYISIKSRIFNGQYIMELVNTCDVTVTFNQEGLPLSSNGSGHGIGTRSILAFGKEYNAMVSFRQQDNRFIFQILISIDSHNK